MTKKKQYRNIVNYTHHIIFLETPHAGLFTESFQDIYGRLASEAVESQFKRWSTNLAKLATQFSDLGNKIAITSVYAGLAVRTPEKIFKVSLLGLIRQSRTEWLTGSIGDS